MFKKEAHKYLIQKGCLSIGQQYSAFTVEEMLNEFATQQVKSLNIYDGSSFDFNKIEKQLDDVLNNETPESLKKWLKSKRK